MKERLDGNWLVFMAKTTNIRKIRQLIFQSSFYSIAVIVDAELR